MTRGPALGTVLACLALTTLNASESKPPELFPPPAGFGWQQIPEVKLAVLMPDGWHFAKETQGETLAYFMTPAELDKETGFETGLTINVFPKLKDRDAVHYARDFIEQVGNTHELLKKWKTAIGRMQGYGCQVRLKSEGKHPAARIHYLAMASKTSNTLYVMFFEAPESEWASAWEKGETMLERFMLDDEF